MMYATRTCTMEGWQTKRLTTVNISNIPVTHPMCVYKAQPAYQFDDKNMEMNSDMAA